MHQLYMYYFKRQYYFALHITKVQSIAADNRFNLYLLTYDFISRTGT